MASIYKRDKTRRNAPWYIAYTDEHGKRPVVKGCTDYKATQEIARKLEADAAKRRRGVIQHDETRYASANRRLVGEHVAEYLTACEHEGQSRVHIRNKRTQLRKMLENTGASRLSDLHADSVGAYLESLRRAGKSARTVNQHRNTAVSFLQWCVERGRLPLNPLAGKLARLDERSDRRRVRRALSADELAWLVRHAGKRRTVYVVAAATGLRRSELAGLRWGDIDLAGGTLTVRAELSKSGREDSIPLHQDAAAVLADAMPKDAGAGLPAVAGTVVFNTIPRVTTFHRDCERARAAWIDAAGDDAEERQRRERSDFLTRFDSEGRQLDFHGLRTTLGTMLARSGTTPQVARMVMRHSDVRITMKHYTDLRLHDATAAMATLPRLTVADEPKREPAEVAATGTDATVAPVIARMSQNDAKPCASTPDGLRLAGPVGSDAEGRYTPANSGVTRDDALPFNASQEHRGNPAKTRAIGAVG